MYRLVVAFLVHCLISIFVLDLIPASSNSETYQHSKEFPEVTEQTSSEFFQTFSFPELTLAEDLGVESDTMSGYYTSSMDINPLCNLVNIK